MAVCFFSADMRKSAALNIISFFSEDCQLTEAAIIYTDNEIRKIIMRGYDFVADVFTGKKEKQLKRSGMKMRKNLDLYNRDFRTYLYNCF